MVFSSLVFLFRFLPIVLILYFVLDKRFKNAFLTAASFFFYAWGEPTYVILIICSITVNYFFGLWIDEQIGTRKKWALSVGIFLNIGCLFYFKYWSFFCGIINSVLGEKVLPDLDIALPVGISFYTFQAVSYLIDLFRGEIEVQHSWGKMALYISFFPQLVAGPIVKYHDVVMQIDSRISTIDDVVSGLRRFCYGLAKKVILANTLGRIVDQIYTLPQREISTALAWVAAIFYTLQIYYDFSGYSDMAIGLARVFGFRLKENFTFPYLCTSITEFWRHWHISLSTWFREYLYIPLGGNRKGQVRTYINLFFVFFCTGLWHGASLTFILWGLYHGFFIILERFTKYHFPLAKNRPAFVCLFKGLITQVIVMIGFVLFRADKIQTAFFFIRQMFISNGPKIWSVSEIVSLENMIIAGIAILMIGILQKTILTPLSVKCCEKNIAFSNAVSLIWAVGLLLLSIVFLVNNSYNPFIYFRF